MLKQPDNLKNIKTANLSVIAHDKVPEFHNFVVYRGPIPLLNDVVSRPPFALLHNSSRPHHYSCSSSSPHHLALLHIPGNIRAVGGARLQLLDWQLVSSSHHDRDSGQDVAAHQCLG